MIGSFAKAEEKFGALLTKTSERPKVKSRTLIGNHKSRSDVLLNCSRRNKRTSKWLFFKEITSKITYFFYPLSFIFCTGFGISTDFCRLSKFLLLFNFGEIVDFSNYFLDGVSFGGFWNNFLSNLFTQFVIHKILCLRMRLIFPIVKTPLWLREKLN